MVILSQFLDVADAVGTLPSERHRGNPACVAALACTKIA
jgi:hypothetical protein